MGEPLLGDPEDLRRILEGLDERNEHLDALTQSVERLTAQVIGLRQQVHDRPSPTQVEHRRRSTVAGLVLFAVLLGAVVDIHVERCGPGARAERVIDALERGVTDVRILRQIGEPREAVGCDVTMPIHAHDRGGFPNGWNVLGWVLYGVAGALLWAWQRRPRLPSAGGPVSGGPDEETTPDDA